MDFFKVASPDEVRELLKTHFRSIFSREETVSLSESLGRYSASRIVSKDWVPNFNKSTVDGYAVKAASTYGASDTIPTMLFNKGEGEMGRINEETIGAAETMYVPTGGMIPEGADAVVMVEYSESLGDDIFLSTSVSHGENLIYKGEDIEPGDIILEKNVRVKPQNIGALAAGGVANIDVVKNPSFYIISTGDEIKGVEDEVKPGEIRDINTYTIGALIGECRCELMGSSVVEDDLELLKDEIKKGMEISDILLLSGGSSVGNKDYTCRAIEELGGEILIHGISIKPGKPTIIGDIGGKLVVGLPGHPVSAMIVFKALLQEIIDIDRALPHRMILSKSVHSTPGRTTYQPVGVKGGAAIPIHGKSGVISLLNKAYGYIIIPSEKEGVNSGDEVEVWPL